MLQLVREQAEGMGLGYAWHTGTVPQPKRRIEIQRFKDDPECRLFLSTDSGAVGLNLQAANIVINLDLPWNPAKLEQRIARAWRKHQKRSVQVINLVCEDSIEHRMFSLLEQKRSLAEGVVDGKGKSEMDLPSGRAAFLERLDSLMGDVGIKREAAPAATIDQIQDQILAQWDDRLELLELHGEGEKQTLLVVADRVDDHLHNALTQQLSQHLPGQTPQLELIDRTTYQTIQRLIEAGVLNANEGRVKNLHRTPALDTPQDDGRTKRAAKAREHLTGNKRKQRLANVLAEGGFATEALTPMREAVETTLQALATWLDLKREAPLPINLIDAELVKGGLLPTETLSLVISLRDDQLDTDEKQAAELLSQGESLIEQAALLLNRAQSS